VTPIPLGNGEGFEEARDTVIGNRPTVAAGLVTERAGDRKRRLRPIDLRLVCGGLVDGLGQKSTLGSPRRGHFDVVDFGIKVHGIRASMSLSRWRFASFVKISRR
jgi:hypothetical protein